MTRKTCLFTAIAVATVFAIVFAGCSSPSASSGGASASSVSSSTTAGTYRQITQQEAQSMMSSEGNYIILDVRRQDEFDSGHIPGAICIPNETITNQKPAELPNLNQLIMVYCRSGNRSKQAAEKLAAIGYTNIVEFGGINTWPGEITMD